MPDTYDVIIVGAGLSGLQAALDLQAAGRTVLILEARDYIGGKTYSKQRPDGKGIQELGACWLNDTNQSMVWSYVQKFGLTPIVQNIDGLVAAEDEKGDAHLFPFGQLPKFEPKDVDNIAAMRDMLEAASLDPATFKHPRRRELDSISLDQWVRESGASIKAQQTARLWVRGTLGQDSSEVSALAYLEICRGGLGLVNLRSDDKHGAQRLRLQEGTQSIAFGMSKLLHSDTIKLDSPVSSIRQLGRKLYEVTTVSGNVSRAQKVIVTVPGPAYKQITFEPPLPRSKEVYINAARYGVFIKYICLFKTPWWRAQGACGLGQSFKGPINHLRDTSADHQDNYALTCFMTAGPGRRWWALSDEDRREACVKQLANLFGVEYEIVESELIDTITSQWTQDRWAGWGCPFAATPPGVIGEIEDGQRAQETSGGIHFVGNELSDEWRGYMEGALRSGQRGAARVLAELSVAKPHL